MGEAIKLNLQESVYFRRAEDDEELFDSESISGESTDDSIGSSTSDRTDNDASSSPNQSSSPIDEEIGTKGPLYQLSSLMDQLPVKRGLSKFYQGKSQSYTSLANVRNIEDLPKKENPYRRKMKPSKSYAGIDATQKQCNAPGPLGKIISKKVSRGNSCASLMARRNNSSNLLCGSKPPAIPVHRNS